MRIKHILPKILSESDVWNTVFDVADTVVGGPLETRIDKIKNRRNYDWFTRRNIKESLNVNSSGEYILRRILIDNNEGDIQKLVADFSYLIGFETYFEDFPTDSFVRFLSEFVRFIQDRHTFRFADFFSYLFNNGLTVVYLWYDPETGILFEVDDAPVIGRRLGIDGNNPDIHQVYPTPYVRLSVDGDLFQDFDTEQISRLFYRLCPIDHVLHDISTVITSDTAILNINLVSAAPMAEVSVIENAVFPFEINMGPYIAVDIRVREVLNTANTV